MSTSGQIRFSAKTHVGRVRQINEDSILSMPDKQVWVVSDGMGGHAAGDLASQMVTEEIAMIPAGLGPRETLAAVREALMRAHEDIVAESERRGGGAIGATVVALVLTDGHFAAFWAGDSRLYRLRDGEISLLTSDHSFVGELVKAGQMSWDEAELHPRSNEITRAVGVGDVLELEKVRGPVEPGDRFLLCSDGLTKYATFAVLQRALSSTAVEYVTDTLLNIALDGGGADNISVIIVDVL